MQARLFRPIAAAALLMFVAPLVRADVTRVEVTSRSDVAYGYERIVGRVHFAVDPTNPRNAVVADLDKAPRNAQGRVEFSADLYILKPKAASASGAALVDIVNRGRRTVLSGFNRARGTSAESELGDGFLMLRGVTVVAVGWEFDARRPGGMSIDVPVVMNGSQPLSQIVRATFTPNEAGTEETVGDLAGYEPADPAGSETALTVRDDLSAPPTPISRSAWQLEGNRVTMSAGFVPGKTYEVAYRAKSLPIAGLGFAAVRDVAAWVKNAPDALARARYVYAFGSSQSGRFLRTFLYQGFNSDEQDRQVLDGVMSHIAGASRLVLNERSATPTTLGMFTATAYPFADRAVPDPVSGASEGLLENVRARTHQPKVLYTDTGVEYWGGGRVAALVHTAPDGSKDLVLPDNVRLYFLAGAQHSPAAFPPTLGTGQQIANPMDYWWTLRALFVAMDRWVREGTAPPASQYPRLDQGTLVKPPAVEWPAIPGVQSPTTLTSGTRRANPFIKGGAGAGAELPLLVPQVDADGNETTGVRLPEQVVPLATYTGWNFRNREVGSPGQLYPLLGSYVPFAKTKAAREKMGDPRLSIEERYPTHEEYSRRIAAAAAALVKAGYLLQDDVPAVTARAEEHWALRVK